MAVSPVATARSRNVVLRGVLEAGVREARRAPRHGSLDFIGSAYVCGPVAPRGVSLPPRTRGGPGSPQSPAPEFMNVLSRATEQPPQMSR
jgi:hypothetical protein